MDFVAKRHFPFSPEPGAKPPSYVQGISQLNWISQNNRTLSKMTRPYKVQRGKHTDGTATRKLKYLLDASQPYLFHEQLESRGRDSF